MPTLADIAAGLGVPVFACNSLKRPLREGGFKVASTDPAEIQAQFADRAATMIGMPTGEASGLVVVDVDIKNGAEGDVWLQAEAHRLPPTRTHKTRSGGLHLIFQAPEGIEIRNSASRVAPGVDVRGAGGYVILPPSPGYSVADQVDPAEMPGWLIDLCLKPAPVVTAPEPMRPRLAEDSAHGSRYGLTALDRECRSIYNAGPGTKHHTLNRAAYAIGGLVTAGELQQGHAFDCLTDALNSIRASCEDFRAAQRTLYGSFHDGMAAPRSVPERPAPREYRDPPRAAAPLGRDEMPEPSQPEPAKRDTFPLIRFEDIHPVPDAKDFVQGTLTEGSAAVVYGESNAGKTFWTTDLALHVAAGMEWNGRRVEAGAVIYVALEGGSGFRNRVAAWRTEKGMEDASIPFFALCCPINLLDPEADMPRFMETLRAVADECGSPKLVVIDTLSRALSGGDENSSEDMGALVRNMDAIRFEIGCCVLFIHHSGKDASRGARGHSLLRAAVDTEIEVKAEEGSSLKTATTVKQRELAKGMSFPFKLKVVEIGHNRHGEAVTTCLVEDAAEEADNAGHVRANRLSGDAMSAMEVLTDTLLKDGRDGFPGIPEGLVSISENLWRDRFYSKMKPGAAMEAKRKSFRRAADALLKRRLVAMIEGRVWIVGEGQ